MLANHGELVKAKKRRVDPPLPEPATQTEEKLLPNLVLRLLRRLHQSRLRLRSFSRSSTTPVVSLLRLPVLPVCLARE